jgi:OCT family organic cation transporter-like MFS transporter 4/5
MKKLELILALGIIPYLSYTVILPESPRWLISKGRIPEAKKILAKALKMNKLPLSRLDKLDKIKAFEKETSEKVFFTDIFKYPGVRRNMICLAFCWFTFTMGYYGLIFNTPSFGWNLYITFCMPAFFTFPILAVQPFLENKLGRKPTMTSLMLFSGVLLLCTVAIPDGKFAHNWPIMVFAWIGTVSCSTAFGVGSVFTKDLFPTTHRTMALSMASASARIGSISSPFVAMLSVYNPIFGLTVYGCFLLVGGIISIWIWPDTKNTKVPDTLEESEKLASSKNTWLFCFK